MATFPSSELDKVPIPLLRKATVNLRAQDLRWFEMLALGRKTYGVLN